jgi:hypothetical protein
MLWYVVVTGGLTSLDSNSCSCSLLAIAAPINISYGYTITIFFLVVCSGRYSDGVHSVELPHHAFDPANLGTLPDGALAGTIVPNSGNIAIGTELSKNGYCKGGFKDQGILFEPRFGFAYDVDAMTAKRTRAQNEADGFWTSTVKQCHAAKRAARCLR